MLVVPRTEIRQLSDGVGVGEGQRHLLVARLDVAEHDEGPQWSSPTMIGRIVAPMSSDQPLRSR